MQILLANAKIMFDKADRGAVSKPLFRISFVINKIVLFLCE